MDVRRERSNHGRDALIQGLKVGAGIWVPCKVRRGAFFNERMVHIDAGGNRWVGFVATHWLKHKIDEGEDEILLKVVEVSGETFSAMVPGNSLKRSLFKGRTEQLFSSDVPLQA